MRLTRTIELVLAFGLVGCASAQPPQERLTASAGALRAAEEVGADKVPAASLYLQLAREELDRAKQLVTDKENERADWMLQRAEADAELAVALAKNAPLVEKAKEVQEQLKAIKGDANK